MDIIAKRIVKKYVEEHLDKTAIKRNGIWMHIRSLRIDVLQCLKMMRWDYETNRITSID